MSLPFQPDERVAQILDERDPLRRWRERFRLPAGEDGAPLLYFAGNSLGLQPVGVPQALEQELDDWARLAVDAHFEGRTPWYSYHESLREPLARTRRCAALRGRGDEQPDRQPAPDDGLLLPADG